MNIWIPPTGPPNGYCSLCDRELWGTVEQLQKHMAACAREHIDDIRAQAPSQKFKDTVFDPETHDVEVEEHLRKVGERMLKEGRMEMLPSERAGF